MERRVPFGEESFAGTSAVSEDIGNHAGVSGAGSVIVRQR